MGKSDPYIFAEYAKVLPKFRYESVAFLGQTSENQFTKLIDSNVRHFYDITLGNWDINNDWKLQQDYDLIICTRCAYFSKDPQLFIDKCKKYLIPGGNALIDWGLGDHWRFEKYKVGWVRDGEHEFAYYPGNFLYSCYWNDDLVKNENVSLFWKYIVLNKNFHYHENDDIDSVIKKEVPKLVNYETSKIKVIFLYPDKPQLYIITLL